MPKYIDANSFLEYEENRCKNSTPLIGTCSFDNATLREELANFLEADVETVRHGEWIHNEGYDKRDNFYMCSLCGRTINIICGDRLDNYPYCHCGAKMDVNDESNKTN